MAVKHSPCLLALFVAIACGGNTTGTSTTQPPCTDDCGPGACEIGGQRYADGASGIPSGDGCNSCSCSAGNLSCTEAECSDSGQSCEYGGATYAHGRSFTADCNTCTCNDGEVLCTRAECGEDPVYCWDHSLCGTGRYCAEQVGLCFLSYPEPAQRLAPPPPDDADPAGGSGAAPAPSGMCEARPSACGEVYAPVCGCDGVTYDNPCSAAAAGVSLLQEGACL